MKQAPDFTGQKRTWHVLISKLLNKGEGYVKLYANMH